MAGNARDGAVTVERWHPDITRGSWLPPGDIARPAEGFVQRVELPAAAAPTDIGRAVLDVLAQPSLRDSYRRAR